MATIQVDLDDALLQLADELALQKSIDRSAIVREALRAYLKNQTYEALEQQERNAYRQRPDDVDDAERWERVADWPDD